MPEIFCDNRKIYYEVYGEGEPLILLNGILMSHISWKFSIPHFSKDKKIILFDFLDQGKSDKISGVNNTHDMQVEVLKVVLDQLGVGTVNILGASYGGKIGMQFAMKYPTYVNRLLLCNTTSHTSPWLRDIFRGWINAAKTYDPETFYNITIPYMYSPMFYSENYKRMEKRRHVLKNIFTQDFLDATVRLILSSEEYDIRTKLKEIEVSTFIVGSDYDFITPPFEQEYMHRNIRNSKFMVIKNCGHASMYEKPNEFVSLINDFLSLEKNCLCLGNYP